MTIEIPPPLRVTQTEQGILVAGDIDASTVGGLASVLLPLPGTGDVELNMEHVEFIDSSGLQVLIQAHRIAAEQDRRMVIANPSAIVHRLLQLSGLSDVFHIVKTVTDAFPCGPGDVGQDGVCG